MAVRSLSPLARGPRPHGGAGARVLPLLDRLAAGPAGRPGSVQRQGHRLLPPPRGAAARARHRPGRDALPRGPAAGAAGGRRLGGARHRRALRGIRGADGGGARRRDRELDHPQRAVGRRVRGPRRGHEGAGPARLADGPARSASSARLPRPGGASSAGEPPGRDGGDLAQSRSGAPGLGVGGRCSGGAASGRIRQPVVPRPAAARRVPRRHGRAVRAARRPVRARRRGPRDDRRTDRLPRDQLLPPGVRAGGAEERAARPGGGGAGAHRRARSAGRSIPRACASCSAGSSATTAAGRSGSPRTACRTISGRQRSRTPSACPT